MAFKENLLKKIEIDGMVETVRKSIGSYESRVKLDKSTMKKLLENTAFSRTELREMELYVRPDEDRKPEILVLDNDLPIYRTTPEDVVLRKSPTIKEMVNIRNAVKILKDSDVLVSKKDASLLRIHKESLDSLDLTFSKDDIDEIQKEGIASLQRDYMDGIKEALVLYAELLELAPLPRSFQMPHHEMFGRMETIENGRYRIVLLVLYNLMQNDLKMVEREIKGTQKEILEPLKSISIGREKGTHEGDAVFTRMSEMVLSRYSDRVPMTLKTMPSP